MMKENVARAIWMAWVELNEIHARDGVPYTHKGTKSSVTEEHFSFVIDELKNAYYELTNKEIMPWFE